LVDIPYATSQSLQRKIGLSERQGLSSFHFLHYYLHFHFVDVDVAAVVAGVDAVWKLQK